MRIIPINYDNKGLTLSGFAEKGLRGICRVEPAAGAASRPSAHAAEAAAPVRTTSENLLAGRPELIIVHAGREYRLRLTQNGKLILTA